MLTSIALNISSAKVYAALSGILGLPAFLQVVVAHSIGKAGIAAQSIQLEHNVPLSASLASAMPSLGVAVATAPAPVAYPGEGNRLGVGLSSPRALAVGLVRDGNWTDLALDKTPEEQGIRNGDEVSVLDANLSRQDIWKLLALTAIKKDKLPDANDFLATGQKFDQQNRILVHISALFTLLVFVTLGLIIADAMPSLHFTLSSYVRNLLATSILGEVATLMGVAYHLVFRAP